LHRTDRDLTGLTWRRLDALEERHPAVEGRAETAATACRRSPAPPPGPG
jgi:hypothetical protein